LGRSVCTGEQHMSHLLSVILREQKIAFLIIDQKFTVIDCADAGNIFGQNGEGKAQNTTIFDAIPELTGCEEIISDVAHGLLPNFELENINRSISDTETHYLTLTLLPYEDDSHPDKLLLVMLADKTAWTQVQQTLTQQRNELTLLKQSLDESNKNLEYLIQHYVPREVGKALLDKRIAVGLGGELRYISVLFADLRSYTAISETQTPNETIEMLHGCLDMASSAIEEAGGVVVNYMGDGIMAVFNAPNELENHEQCAVQAGLEIQARAAARYEQQKQDNLPLLQFGVGVNTGVALIGNIGSTGHYQYSAIGDTVNVASRFCSHARPDEVLIGENTFKALDKSVTTRALDPIKFKGKSQPMTTYSVNYAEKKPIIVE